MSLLYKKNYVKLYIIHYTIGLEKYIPWIFILLLSGNREAGEIFFVFPTAPSVDVLIPQKRKRTVMKKEEEIPCCIREDHGL